ncbi:hypothetical protein MMPV_003807 [Pyropia vietnamensis]
MGSCRFSLTTARVVAVLALTAVAAGSLATTTGAYKPPAGDSCKCVRASSAGACVTLVSYDRGSTTRGTCKPGGAACEAPWMCTDASPTHVCLSKAVRRTLQCEPGTAGGRRCPCTHTEVNDVTLVPTQVVPGSTARSGRGNGTKTRSRGGGSNGDKRGNKGHGKRRNKGQSKSGSKDQSKSGSKGNGKRRNKGQSKSGSKDQSKSRNKGHGKRRNKGQSKSGSKDQSKRRNKGHGKRRNKDQSKSGSKDQSKSRNKGQSKNRNKGNGKSRNKGQSKSRNKGNGKSGKTDSKTKTYTRSELAPRPQNPRCQAKHVILSVEGNPWRCVQSMNIKQRTATEAYDYRNAQNNGWKTNDDYVNINFLRDAASRLYMCVTYGSADKSDLPKKIRSASSMLTSSSPNRFYFQDDVPAKTKPGEAPKGDTYTPVDGSAAHELSASHRWNDVKTDGYCVDVATEMVVDFSDLSYVKGLALGMGTNKMYPETGKWAYWDMDTKAPTKVLAYDAAGRVYPATMQAKEWRGYGKPPANSVRRVTVTAACNCQGWKKKAKQAAQAAKKKA